MAARIPWLALLAILGLTACAAPAYSQSREAAKSRKLLATLDELIETKEFVNPMRLKDALQVVFEMGAARGLEVETVVDVPAFRFEDTDAPSPYDAEVSLPALPRKVTIGKALRMLLNQVPVKTTYVVRDGVAEIIPASQAAAKVLAQYRVTASFDKTTLREVLEDLSGLSGAPIVLDARVKEKADERVTIGFNNLSLEDCLVTLTEQAGLRYVTLNSALLVTLSNEAKGIEERYKQRERHTPPELMPPLRGGGAQ